MKKNIFLILLLSSCFISKIFAAGVANNTIGIQESARCSFVGVANDSSSVAHNPAGLTNIPEGKFDAEIGALYNFTSFTYKDASKEYESDEQIILPSAFAAASMGNIAFGFGVYCANGSGTMEFSNVPLTMDLGLGPVSTITDVKAEVYSLAFSPAVAYKILPNVSIGLTVEFLYGRSYSKNNIDIPAINGNIKTDEKVDGLGGYDVKLGLFAKLNEALSLGLLVKTPAKLETKGTRKTDYSPGLGLPDTSEDVKITEKIPWYFMSGIGYKILPNLDASLDFGYRLWSKYEKTEKLDGQKEDASSVDKGTLKNACVVGAGVKYGLLPVFDIIAGFMYIPTAKKDKDVSFPETDFDQTITSLSVAYKAVRSVELHLGCAYVKSLDKRDVPAGNTGGGGKVDSNTIYILGGVRGIF